MKKLLKKILIGVLGMSMLLMTACSSTNREDGMIQKETNKEIAMGRYIEKSLDLPDMGDGFIMGICQTEGGLELYIYNEGIRSYRLVEGEKWEEGEVLWKDAYSQLEKGWIQGSIWNEGGDLYFAYFAVEEERTDIYAVRDGEHIERLNIQWEGENTYITPETIRVLPNEDIIVADPYIGTQRYSGEDGRFMREYGGEAGSFDIVEDKIYQIEYLENAIKSYDLETGKLVETIPCEGVDELSKLIAGKEGDLYLANREGISHLVKGGSIWEKIVPAEMTSFGMPTLYATQLFVEKDSFFVLFAGDKAGYQLKQYVYSKDTPSKPTTEVTIYMLEDNPVIRQAATQYQMSHAEVQVNFQVGCEAGSAVTKSDAIRGLNTQLLAGKGPDILVLDELAIDTYIQKGVLEDMSEWSKPFIDQGMWLPDVVKGYEKEGKLYAIPTHFTIPTLWGDQEVVQASHDLYSLAQWAKEHPDEKLITYESKEQLIEQFYLSTATTWLDEKGNIKEEAFAKFLEAIKAVMQVGIQKEEEITRYNGDKDRYFGVNMGSMLDVAYHESAVHLMIPESMMDIGYGAAANEKRGQTDFTRLGDTDKGIFIPRNIVGVNAQSNQKVIAQGIIETALAEQIQVIDFSNGFPVNAKSLKAFLQMDMNTSYSVTDGERELMVDSDDGYKETMEKFLSLCQTVNEPVTVDEVLMDMILEETKAYFNDEMTASEAAKAVNSRVHAYLAE